MSVPDAPPSEGDGGFITPAFAGLALAMVLVAAAFLLAARQDLADARAVSARQAEQLRLEGVATASALRVRGQAGLAWRAWGEGGDTRVIAEPEGRKINPLFAARPDNHAVVARLVGPANAEAVAGALADRITASTHLVRRAQIVEQSADPRWRACAASVFSAYSQQTALTWDPEAGAPGHVGEIWRIVAVGRDGAWVDQVVRYSADAARPFDLLEQDAGHAGGAARIACKTLIDPEEA